MKESAPERGRMEVSISIFSLLLSPPLLPLVFINKLV